VPGRPVAPDVVPPPPGDRGPVLNSIERAVLLVVVGVLLSCVFLLQQAHQATAQVASARQAAEVARVVSLDNRVLLCQVALGLEVRVDRSGPCFRPDALSRYDPAAPRGNSDRAAAILEAACDELAKALRSAPPGRSLPAACLAQP
jgi:hypothetical protein